jgi:hypothetical protein
MICPKNLFFINKIKLWHLSLRFLLILESNYAWMCIFLIIKLLGVKIMKYKFNQTPDKEIHNFKHIV